MQEYNLKSHTHPPTTEIRMFIDVFYLLELGFAFIDSFRRGILDKFLQIGYWL